MQYELIIATDPPQQRVTLRLLDDHGVQRGAQQVHLPEHSPLAVHNRLLDPVARAMSHNNLSY